MLDFSPYKSLEAVDDYAMENTKAMASVGFYGHLATYIRQILAHDFDNLRLVT